MEGTIVAGAGFELTVRSESIQQLYRWYLSDRFRVNRRYQRKLVWSVEEKRKLIDSIIKDLPIPLFLVAEVEVSGDIHYELIDGMQRLNAIFSFLENEFSLGEAYFDLDALADTKQLKDAADLKQVQPVIARDLAVSLSNYNIALSVFRSRSGESVDEVFRRINSGGRRLSRQELRQAGTVSALADVVRVISSRIRGDTSPGDVVALKTMPELSITNRDLDYGVVVDDIFWVKEGVLRRADIRQSIDEQLVLDLLIDCLIDPAPSTGPDVRDTYYNYSTDSDDDSASTSESRQVAAAIDAYGTAELERDFMRVYDEIRRCLDLSDERLTNLIRAGTSGRAPRYFHAIFIAMFELMHKDRLRIRSHEEVVRGLNNIAGSGALSTPGGGGDWTSTDKRRAINSVKGNISNAFEPAGEGEDFSRFGWASRLETTLSNALVEQQLFDCKQGFLRLDLARVFDQDAFSKICRTLTAMANAGPGRVGHIAVGVVDSEGDGHRVAQLDSVTAYEYRGFRIVGIAREAAVLGLQLNDYWTWLLQKLGGDGKLDKAVANSIRSESRLVHYYDGLAVALLTVRSQSAPVFYDNELVIRQGSETVTVQPGPDYAEVFQRFA